MVVEGVKEHATDLWPAAQAEVMVEAEVMADNAEQGRQAVQQRVHQHLWPGHCGR